MVLAHSQGFSLQSSLFVKTINQYHVQMTVYTTCLCLTSLSNAESIEFYPGMTSWISLSWGILHSSSRLFFFLFFADISLLLQGYKNRNTFFFPLKWCWPQFFSSLGCKIIKSACKEGNVYKAMILMLDAIFNPNIYASPSNLC